MRHLLLACFLVGALTVPAFADNPTMGPWDVLSTTQALRFISVEKPAKFTYTEAHWQTAMRDAGICALVFLADGTGVRMRVANWGTDCSESHDEPPISFQEFRRRMGTP